MMLKHHRQSLTVFGLAVLTACTTCVPRAVAAPVLESVETTIESGCRQIHIRTVEPVVFDAASTTGHGVTAEIPLETLAGGTVDAQNLPPGSNDVGLKDVLLAPAAGGSFKLRLIFAKPVDYSIIAEAETRHIRIDVAAVAGATGCVRPVPQAIAGKAQIAKQTEPPASETPDNMVPELPKDAATDIIAMPKPDVARLNPKLHDNAADLKSDLPSTITLRSMGKVTETVEDPATWHWKKSGRISQTSIATTDEIAALRQDNNNGRFLSATSLFAQVTGGNARDELEFVADASAGSAWHDHENIAGLKVQKLQGTWRDKQTDTALTLGRQIKQDAGVLGRFDGGTLDVMASPEVRLGVVAGSPAYDALQGPFADGRLLFGTNVEYAPKSSGWRTQLYFVEQRFHGEVDRRAIGVNASYDGESVSSLFGLDYDIHQKALTSANWQGAWRPSDRLTLSLSADYVTQPLLLTSNALIGRSDTNFATLLDRFNSNDVKQLAADRTAAAYSASATVSYILNSNWDIFVDASWYDVSGTVASGGVAADAATDSEIYLDLQVQGQDVLRNADSLSFGLSGRTSDTLKELAVKGSWRVPVRDDVSMTAKLRTGLRQRPGEPFKPFIIPGLALEYRFSDAWSFNAEVGFSYDASMAASSPYEYIGLAGVNWAF
jgi:hypothetical protein